MYLYKDKSVFSGMTCAFSRFTAGASVNHREVIYSQIYLDRLDWSNSPPSVHFVFWQTLVETLKLKRLKRILASSVFSQRENMC